MTSVKLVATTAIDKHASAILNMTNRGLDPIKRDYLTLASDQSEILYPTQQSDFLVWSFC